ncbi:Phospholipase D precursor [Vibrio quintilis]|uniref:Phospholipase D n=2 Tax=Vibrio quintilis TaxID=1117707 RepID=A0A1M7YPU1_9VIBR|nr:Phospholipase D precursor [Vibrio quintilis]
MSNSISRRRFLELSAKGFGAAVISYGLMGCNSQSNNDTVSATFQHGVASGDPLTDAVILWTRVTPEQEGKVQVSWEVATDPEFSQVVTNGSTFTDDSRDYTIKVDAIGLEAGTSYYYRFFVDDVPSTTGVTKTLPEGDISSVKLAVVSCSNFPAGYFNVFDLAAQRDDLDALLHLGDYIYEYPRGGYASDNAASMGREVLPATELLSLSDYRTRYAQYRTDSSLQKIHAKVPFITVWDDHEVANDAWKDGAENHNDGEGDYDTRKEVATQAYFEWLPIRPWREGDHEDIYRSFSFGNLVDLHMLDTRLLARDKQLSYSDYIDSSGNFDQTGLAAALADSTRTMLGQTQLAWLQQQLTTSTATWQVLGQQVLMGTMNLPAAIVTGQMSVTDYATLGELAQLAARQQAGDTTLTDEELAYLAANQDKLTDEVLALLNLPDIPYNLDAWDGYGYEREVLLQTLKSLNKNTVIVAGDTHNAWANNITDSGGDAVAVEFATSSVSSPGMEVYLGFGATEAETYENAITGMVSGLQYTNLLERGYLLLELTPEQANATWYFVDTILSDTYSEQAGRRRQAYMQAGDPKLVMVDS